MTYLRELNIFIEEDGQTSPFALTITSPEKVQGEDDYFCVVHAPVLFKRDKRIFGMDSRQAADLSIKFVKDLLAGKRLVDEHGDLVIL